MSQDSSKLDNHDEYISDHHIQSTEQTSTFDDDLDDLSSLPVPSSDLNARATRRSPKYGNKGIKKGKGRSSISAPAPEGECHLLSLPQDALHLLLTRLPPRSLRILSTTCRALRDELRENEAIWRESYVNRFFFDGASRSARGKEEVRVLVQPCGEEAKGWKKEGLEREGMLERWINSKAGMVTHQPPVGLVQSLSLSYPPFVPSKPKTLEVGKLHQTPTRSAPQPLSAASTPISIQGETADEEASAPPKMTHRQKYEALLAATTRPAPYVLSAGLAAGGVVRSDPLSGKVSKGFWGPGRDANFHLRPHLDHRSPPTAVHLQPRSQNYILWGLLTGQVVHTTVLSKHHAAHGGRASSLNLECSADDAHEGEVNGVHSPSQGTAAGVRFVSGGADGRIKYWEVIPGRKAEKGGGGGSGKRTPGEGEAEQGRIECLFTSSLVLEPLANRSEASKRRQLGKPDEIVVARCSPEHDVIAAITHDGDLRIWYGASTGAAREVRLDAGSEEERSGAVQRMELEVRRVDAGLMASVLVLHRGGPSFWRHGALLPDDEGQEPEITSWEYIGYGEGVTALGAFLEPSLAISTRRSAPPVLSTPLEGQPGEHVLAEPALEPASPSTSNFGRFVVIGTDTGMAHIFPWDPPRSYSSTVSPLRSFQAHTGRITAIDQRASLIAFGTFDGSIKIFDPLPPEPVLLRSLQVHRLNAADLRVAASDEFDALYYTVNRIVLEADLVVASVGRKVVCWRAGRGKGREKGKGKGGVGDARKASGGRGEGRAGKPVDMRSVNREASDSHREIREENAATRVPTSAERQHWRAMEDLGLEDGDEAVQYAMMLSMQQRGGEGVEADVADESWAAAAEEEEDGEDEETRNAIRAVEEFERREREEVQEIADRIRRAEML